MDVVREGRRSRRTALKREVEEAHAGSFSTMGGSKKRNSV